VQRKAQAEHDKTDSKDNDKAGDKARTATDHAALWSVSGLFGQRQAAQFGAGAQRETTAEPSACGGAQQNVQYLRRQRSSHHKGNDKELTWQTTDTGSYPPQVAIVG
jgi:hypothetical protein